MINLEKLVFDIMTAGISGASHDPKTCLNCDYHPSRLTFEQVDGGQHCYMFKTVPEGKCLQFRTKDRQ